jgi:hypothetical protein
MLILWICHCATFTIISGVDKNAKTSSNKSIFGDDPFLWCSTGKWMPHGNRRKRKW